MSGWRPEGTSTGRTWDTYLAHAVPCRTYLSASLPDEGCEEGRKLYSGHRPARIRCVDPQDQ